MTTAAPNHATATLSGRELALQRRQAMARHGKAGIVKAGTAPAAQRTAAAVRRPPGAQTSVAADAAQAATRSAAAPVMAESPARARRRAMATMGKAGLQPAVALQSNAGSGAAKGCECDGACACRTSSAGGHSAATEPKDGHGLAKARRAALAQSGKSAAQSGERATVAPAGKSSVAAASGRLLAMQRRQALSQSGQAGLTDAVAQTGSRMAARDTTPVPPKVEQGHTLAGQTVTGTMVERNSTVTGNEAGSCRVITGTEYIGVEQFKTICGTRSRSTLESGGKDAGSGAAELRGAPQKSAVTHTAKGNIVTGTVAGRSARATGDEAGSCKPVTGTEYLTAEQFRDVCRSKPPATPRKVSVMSSRDGWPVSGSAVDRAEKVTGNEVGSCRSVTGSQYYSSADFAGLCEANGPRKVGEMQTLDGRTVTGSEVAPSARLTGDESFQCQTVTGTDYIGPRQLSAVCPPEKIADVKPVRKVGVDATLRGQPVSGSAAGRAGNVTGNEAGGCAPISGTPYLGQAQFANFCPPASAEAQTARVRDSAVIPATVVTGDRPGAGGSRMTGDERGACGTVSGTPYLGSDNMPPKCAGSGRFVSRPRVAETPSRPPPPAMFSIASPARQARERQAQGVTGNSASSGRITGPINKADGLITGTPEFRHGDDLRRPAQAAEPPAAAQRVSGEGSQRGRGISGDAWDAATRVTGTEGTSSMKRNPSMRGQARGAGSSATTFREIERPGVSDSVVTGSSGNTVKGATVTVSGGARG